MDRCAALGSGAEAQDRRMWQLGLVGVVDATSRSQI